MQIIVSGVQPTGVIHLGNYLGTIANWQKYQQEYHCYFPIVDLHAITAEIPQRKEFSQNILNVAACYIACGIDPSKAVIFQQSSVLYHSELFWLLSNFCQLGKLNRMTQFKDKSGNNKEKASLGLYAYPVLMAADILLYDADIVPVGDDQTQHLELTCDIVASFNHHFGEKILKKPEAMYNRNSTRIMSLKDGTKKMSKSAESDLSRINLLDDADMIAKKISKAKTDSETDFFKDFANRPELKNLLTIFAAITEKEVDDLQAEYNGKGYKLLKEDLSSALIAKLGPIREQIIDLLGDRSYLINQLKEGSARANETAERNISEIKSLMGFTLND